MTINTSWKIEIGAPPTDFSSRVMGLQIEQNVDVNVVGQGSCQITLLNKDGALTPGGGGAYSSTDWFTTAIRISSLTNTGGANTETLVFAGAVTNFELGDDGVFSTVTIHGLDFLTFAARQPAPTVGTSGNQVYTGRLSSWTNSSLPPYGTTTLAYFLTNLGSADPICNRGNAVYSTRADAIQIGAVPVANDVVWHTGMTITGSYIEYNVNCIPSTITRTNANAVDFEFDPPGSLSGSKLPFEIDSFTQGFDLQNLVTNARCQAAFAGSTMQTAESSTRASYGYRTQSFLAAEFENDTAALNMATNLVNRYGQARFTPLSLSLTATLVKRLAASAAHQKWHSLLGISTGLWQKAKITWTGSGAASQTAYCVIKGRRISVTPAETVVTLSLGNWTDNHSFILDTDQLDVDRLG